MDNPIPPLFPDTLQRACVSRVLKLLVARGRFVESLAKEEDSNAYKDDRLEDSVTPRYAYDLTRRRRSSLSLISECLLSTFLAGDTQPPLWMKISQDGQHAANQRDFFFTQSPLFVEAVTRCRNELVAMISARIFDALVDAARRNGNVSEPGHLFCFSVLCNERLTKLVACDKPEEDIREEDHVLVHPEAVYNWSDFLGSAIGTDIFLACLGQLKGLTHLTVHKVCTNDMLFVIADTCSKLHVLDISFSTQVTDLGLVYLCGATTSSITERYLTKPSEGCKHLRELIFLENDPLMPKVVACLLRHLPLLEVLDLSCLHQGIDYYLHGALDGSYHPKPHRIHPLKLVHYTGSDKLADVMAICPKLRTFKLRVTESLPTMGNILQTCPNVIDHVTLVFSAESPYIAEQSTLVGLIDFLQACGNRISSLQIESCDQLTSLVDLTTIADECKFLDVLCFTSFWLFLTTPIAENSLPLNYRYLTVLKLTDIRIGRWAKESVRHLLVSCPELERLHLAFAEMAHFFTDFLLDDILAANPLARLEAFHVQNVSLTLISALRLINSRPKLRSLGRLLKWDVEHSELHTFAEILRKANGLKLLQEIKIY